MSKVGDPPALDVNRAEASNQHGMSIESQKPRQSCTDHRPAHTDMHKQPMSGRPPCMITMRRRCSAARGSCRWMSDEGDKQRRFKDGADAGAAAGSAGGGPVL
ncbi:hypothetical protein KC19_9G114200 [Ceratodon purpureus]|uniref:Uncharacterized protein n=1 Tax=Ceratodon purpureus TaxID=3225 RepID=A0A8T0GU21_CERPU|nr:hypothetical protein KC19_9G114200 [Ceratodon purpureus]